MKKVFALFALMSFLAVGMVSNNIIAQDSLTTYNDSVAAAVAAAEAEAAAAVVVDAPPEVPDEQGAHAVIMQQFIDGGPLFMGIVLICLILGLAFAIERIISLTLVSTNVKKLMTKIDAKLAAGDVEGAKEICRSNRSPVASIIYQGLERVKHGVGVVEKSVVAYGSVQMGILEKGLIWVSLFIALAPMLGFMGTIIGMVDAFTKIQQAGQMEATTIAGSIKVALLTTLFGLIVAIILQIFYNFIVSRIDSIVNDMEDASISFIDMLMKYNITGEGNSAE